MKANQLVQKLGQKLLGKMVNTPACGDYPGGMATVTQLAPDQEAPKVVFQVGLPHWGSIGVFSHEDLSLLVDKLGMPTLNEHWRN